MNTVSRGIRNAFRNMIRTGSIVIILGLSIGLIIAMLAAKQAVTERITSVKSSSGNTITISPAGTRGFEGGGTALTADQIAKVTTTTHVTRVVSTLSDRLTTSSTNLQSAIQAGSLGQRNANSSGVEFGPPPSGQRSSSNSSSTTTRTFTPPVTITGVSDSSAIGNDGTALTWKSGGAFDASSSDLVAVVGSSIAEKNNLSVGSTFTAYNKTLRVVGVYTTSNTFSNNGVYVPLTTLQSISDQAGSITSVTATVDSSDNLASTTTAISSTLGSAADVTNSQTIADATAKPLESVAQITLFSLIGAIIAGAIIILLTMLMIVRERRREIGVMKAIGSSNLGIVWQFVVEALTLTTLALLVGTGIGVAAATPLTTALIDNSTSSNLQQVGPGAGRPRGFGQASQQAIRNIQSSVGTDTLLYGLGATLLIAILGSALPAFMISKVKPADAMRNE